MWSEELRNNLSKELDLQLDNKNFFNARDYYSSQKSKLKQVSEEKLLSNMTYAKPVPSKKTYDYENAVKGISFSNKVEVEKKQNTVANLSMENRKIYKIADLLSANLIETIVIPFNVQSTSLALVKKFDWKDVLFADLETAWGIIKSKFKW